MPDLEDVDVSEQLEEEQGTRLVIEDVTEKTNEGESKPQDKGTKPQSEVASPPEEIPLIKPRNTQQEEGIFSGKSMLHFNINY